MWPHIGEEEKNGIRWTWNGLGFGFRKIQSKTEITFHIFLRVLFTLFYLAHVQCSMFMFIVIIVCELYDNARNCLLFSSLIPTENRLKPYEKERHKKKHGTMNQNEWQWQWLRCEWFHTVEKKIHRNEILEVK